MMGGRCPGGGGARLRFSVFGLKLGVVCVFSGLRSNVFAGDSGVKWGFLEMGYRAYSVRFAYRSAVVVYSGSGTSSLI